jgi:DNA invertase Pin-like site-specific DNA recombinase
MAKLLGYRRVSHVGTRKELHSPDEQSEEIQLWAGPRGHDVHLLEPELDGKGDNPDRPILREAIEAIKAGEYSGLVVAYLSRAGRGLRLMLDLWDEVEDPAVGGVVYFARENVDGSTTSGKLQRNLLASIAQHELEERRDGFERAARGAVEAGIWQRRQTPIGYVKNPETRRLVVDDRAAEVRRAAADYLSGKTLSEISREIGMTPGGVRAMLRNRVYLGELKVRSYVNSEAHPAILDPGTFEAVQRKMASASRPPRSLTAPAMLLAGLARCAACGHIMTRGRSHADLVYRCIKNHSGATCPRPAAISCRRLDPYVEAIALQELDRLSVSATSASKAGELQKEVAAAEAELSNYLQAVHMAGISAPDAAAGMRSRREKVDAARARLRAELARSPSLPAIEGGAEIWESLNPTERNELLRSLLAAVAVRSVGAGVRVDVADRTRVFRFGAEVMLTAGRTGTANGLVPLPWPDLDSEDVLRIAGPEDSLERPRSVD